jgi:hypothetical protein
MSTNDTGGVSGVPSAEVGDCLDTDEIGEEIPAVDCSDEHDAQVFHKFAMADADDFPGDDAISQEVVDGCEPEFEGFVGAAYDESALEYDAIVPNEQTWGVGDREFICVVFLADGSTTTESFQDSGL